MLKGHRDIDFIKLDKEKYLVIACDSCGSIGLKEHDVVKVPYYITGKYTARVCLMEILSLNAKVIGFTANICNEPNPTGNELLKGIKDELRELDLNIPITISTEKNMETSMTALGITAIGIISEKDLLLNKVLSGNYVYSLGIPSIGNEVLENKIADIKILPKLLCEDYINEIIPVGSSGIKGELEKLSESYDLKTKYNDEIPIDIDKSAGPSTVLIIISKNELIEDFGASLTFIGRLV